MNEEESAMKKQHYYRASLAALILSLMFILPASASADDNETLYPDLKITPSTLNMKSRGKFITAHINLPQMYALPDAQDVKLHLVIDDNDTDNITALKITEGFFGGLTVKFSRKEVQTLIADYIEDLPAEATLSVTIDVDNETLRYTDDIRVIMPGKGGKGGKGNGKGGTDHGNGNGKGGTN